MRIRSRLGLALGPRRGLGRRCGLRFRRGLGPRRGLRPRLGLGLAAFAPAACGPAAPSPSVVRSAPEPPPVEAGVPAAPGEYEIAPDVLHYEIELALGAPEIEARATLSVRPNGAAELPLDLVGLGVRSVHVDGAPSAFAYADGKLTVPLDPTGESGAPDLAALDTVHVAVAYHGTPDDGLIIRPNVHGFPTAFVDNWPNRARFWLPSVDHPSDKATAGFTVHAPNGWQVVANGAQVAAPTPTAPDALGGPATRGVGAPTDGVTPSGKTTWRWATSVPHPTYTLVAGAAEFAVESLGRAACGAAPVAPSPDGCVDVSYWVYPQDTAFARQVFRRAPQMVDYFVATIGPYPFEKLANVQSATRFGGMENSSAIFYSEEAIAAGRLGEGTVSHEIAHQWFGDSATEGEWSHLWLSEGFATYFGALFFEAADGVEDFRARMERSRRSYVESDDARRPMVDIAGPDNLFDLLNRNNYAKGAWVLHMLRGLLGDETFFGAIRSYYAQHAYATALTADLQRVFEESSGRSLEWFFEQWVRQPGHPVLEHEWEVSEDGAELIVTVVQTQSPEWPAFRFPLEIAIVGPATATGSTATGPPTVRRPGTEAGARRERVELRERAHTFRFPVEAPPEAVVLDPDGWLLRG